MHGYNNYDRTIISVVEYSITGTNICTGANYCTELIVLV